MIIASVGSFHALPSARNSFQNYHTLKSLFFCIGAKRSGFAERVVFGQDERISDHNNIWFWGINFIQFNHKLKIIKFALGDATQNFGDARFLAMRAA
jgi:hypothetical protein